jgi:hypothetical protein
MKFRRVPLPERKVRIAVMTRFFLTVVITASVLLAQPKPGEGSIEGHVVNAQTNAPVRRAAVTLTAPQIRLTALSDPEGKFQFFGLPAGTYHLSARSAGYLEHGGRRPISLGDKERVSAAEIRLPPQGSLSGRVLDEDGEPVSGAMIMLHKQIYRYGKKMWDRQDAQRSETGDFRFPTVRPGQYLVQAYAYEAQVDNRYGSPPQASYVLTYYPSVAGQQQATPILVGAGAEIGGINIRLLKAKVAPFVRVRGTVTGLAANSGTVASLGFSPTDGNPLGGGSAQANPPDYRFDARVPPGQYVIFGAVYSNGPEAFGSVPVAVAGDMDGVVLPMRPAPDIHSQIVLAEGGQVNLKDVRITVTSITPNVVSGVFDLASDEQGKLASFPTANRRPGHFAIVNVKKLPDGYYLREMKLGNEVVSPDDFEIQASAELQFVLSNTAGTIAGTVQDADHKPVPGSTVTLIPSDGRSRPVKQAVDDAGSFRFTNLRPGSYKLFAWEDVDDDLWPDPEFRKKYESRAIDVEVHPSETQNAQPLLIPADEIK